MPSAAVCILLAPPSWKPTPPRPPGYEDVPANDEEALLKAATAQPVAVGICASPSMQFYRWEGGLGGLGEGSQADGRAAPVWPAAKRALAVMP
jgi:hypothetical protein